MKKKFRLSSALRGHGYQYRKLRKEILARHPYCEIRGPRCTKIATTLDYIVPFSRGGQCVRENLRPACSSCNSSRGNRFT